MTEDVDGRPGRGRSGGPRPRPGRDLRTALAVELAEAYRGDEKPLTVTRPEPCAACDGRGFGLTGEPVPCPLCDGRGRITHVRDSGRGTTRHREPCGRCGGAGELPGPACAVCDGDGRVERAVTVGVEVPAGVDSGRTLRLAEAGALGRHGGPRGDLLVDVEVADHPTFAREGADLHTRQPVSFPQAAFGATVAVPTLGRPVDLTVPAGTQTGETFRVPGEGMPRSEGSGAGDLYVGVHVVTPDELTPTQRAALRDYADATGDDADGDDAGT